MNKRAGNLFGVAYASPSKVVSLIEKNLGAGRVQLIRNGDLIARKRAYVVIGTDALRAMRDKLGVAKSTIVVVDALPKLMGVQGITLLDADPSEPCNIYWRPRKIDSRKLQQHLKRVRVPPETPKVVPVDAIANLISKVKDEGVLSSILTFSHAFSRNKLERERVFNLVFRYLRKEIRLSLLEKRLVPNTKRDSYDQARSVLLKVLKSPYAERMSKVLIAAHPHYDPKRLRELSDKHHVDRFECNYISNFVRRRTKAARQGRE